MQRDEVSLTDDLLNFDEQEMNFFSVHKIREYYDDLDSNNDNTIISVFIRLDNAYDIYIR